MLFLVFDLELVLLLPLSVTLNSISSYGFWVAVLFFVILTIGFILEIGTGAISLKSEHKEDNYIITPMEPLVLTKLNNGDIKPNNFKLRDIELTNNKS
jgi:hypothetical protein